MFTNFFIGYNVYENTFKVYIKKRLKQLRYCKYIYHMPKNINFQILSGAFKFELKFLPKLYEFKHSY